VRARHRRTERHDAALLQRVLGRGGPVGPVGDEFVEVLETALWLQRSAPSPPADQRFVEELRRRMQKQRDNVPDRQLTRRQLAAGAAAAAVTVVGAAGEVKRLVRPRPAPDQVLEPNVARWLRVAASTDVLSGQPVLFESHRVRGVLRRDGDGQVRGVSAVCTHRGCQLVLAGHRLDCPCHRAAFTLAGDVLSRPPEYDLPPLPRLRVRESDVGVEVLLPVTP
jgi:Rieske Fe-S protein